jgi:hypothetical protein
MKATLTNINKDIGPNSLEILSYLRPIYDEEEEGERHGSKEEIHAL